MEKRLPCAIVLACFGLSLGCSSGPQTSGDELESLKVQITELQREITKHSLQLEKIHKTLHEERTAETLAQMKKKKDKLSKDVGLKPSTLKTELRKDLWSDRKLFDRAFSLKESEPQRSKSLFVKLIKHHERSPLADNALYWLGMMQFKEGSYHPAVVLWDKIVRDYPRSNRVSDALLQMIKGYKKLNKNEKAKLAFDRLQRDFSHSEAAQEAKGLL